MLSKTILLGAAIIGFAAAQSSNSTTPTLTLPLNTSAINSTVRRNLCEGQKHTCIDLCSTARNTGPNDCDEQQLTFNCRCANGTVPDLTGYSESLAAGLCRISKDQCVASHPNDLAGQTTCLDVKCGEGNSTVLGPNAHNTASASSTPSATSGSGSGSQSSGSGSQASPTGAAASSSSRAAAAHATAMAIAKNYGTGALAAGMMAVFGMAL